MATPTRTYIEKALALLSVKKATIPSTTDEVNDGIETLCDMLIEWDSVGIRLGGRIVIDADTDLEVPRYSNWAIKTNLAIRMAPEYEVSVRPELQFAAKDSFDNLFARLFGKGLQNVALPSTLPIGQGNEFNTWFSERFYPDTYTSAQAAANGDIVTDELGRRVFISSQNLVENTGSRRTLITG